MNGAISDAHLVSGLKSGDSRAWARVYENYRGPLSLFVRGQLPPAIRSKVDDEDILQEVFRSVFIRVRQGTFDCDCDERLWEILCIRATKRLRGELRRFHRCKRDTRHEDRLTLQPTQSDCVAEEPADSHAGPEKLFALHDELLVVVDRLDLRSQILVYLRLDNYTFNEIADLTRWSLRTVKRLWKGIRQQGERRRRENDE